MGKRSSAGKTPPSKGVPSGPWMRHSQCSRSSSETGPAVMPSGGLLVRARYSWRRRRWAVDWAMVVATCDLRAGLAAAVVVCV